MSRALTWYDYDEAMMLWLSASGLCERTTTRAEFNAGLKKIYPPEFIRSLVHQRNPWFDLVAKADHF